MLTILRPGQEPLEFNFILLDFEGTLASDRRVHPKVKDKINLLSKRAKVFILTKEEKILAEETLKKVKGDIVCLTEGEASQGKLDLLQKLGASQCIAFGNGADDAPMMEKAGFGVCVMGREGTYSETLKKADMVFMNIVDALDFLLKPLRQKATLGN
jgi:soluble P-type ATPase